jgi:hypothetical protein
MLFKIQVFWNVMLCCWARGTQRFGRTGSSSPRTIPMREKSVVWVEDRVGHKSVRDIVREAVVYWCRPQRGTLVGTIW